MTGATISSTPSSFSPRAGSTSPPSTRRCSSSSATGRAAARRRPSARSSAPSTPSRAWARRWATPSSPSSRTRWKRCSTACDGATSMPTRTSWTCSSASADVLEQAVEAAVAGREGDVIATELVELLRAMGAEQTATTGWTVAAPATPGTLVRVRLAPDTPLRGVRAFIILQLLAKLGEVTGTEPSSETLQFEWDATDFALRILSPSPADEIGRVIRSAGDVDDVQIGDDKAAPASRARFARRGRSSRRRRRYPPRAVRPRRSRFIRIDVRRLDTLMNLIGELVIARGRLSQIASELGDKTADGDGRRLDAADHRAARRDHGEPHGAGGAGVRSLSACRARRGALSRQADRVRRRGQGDRARSLDARRDRRLDRAPAAQRDRPWHRNAGGARRGGEAARSAASC